MIAGENPLMGNSDSKTSGAKDKVSTAMSAAIRRCDDSLKYLKTSANVLKQKQRVAEKEATAAYNRGDHQAGVMLLKRADRAAADIAVLIRRQEAIETQRGMIEQQQLNAMLTDVLVQTSAALQTAQAAGDREQGGAEVVDEANDRMMEIFDRQQEMIEAQTSFSVPVANVTEQPDHDPETAAVLARLESMAAKSQASDKPKVAAAPAPSTHPFRPPPPAAADFPELIEPAIPAVPATVLVPPPKYKVDASPAPSAKQTSSSPNVVARLL